MPRTLDGLTVGDFDEIIVNDDLTVKGSTTLSGMNLDGSLTATAINASGDVATTGDVSGANLINLTNLTIPHNVYNDGGQWIMTFDAGIFHPNDDSSYYNYCLDDDVLKTYGRGHVRSSSLEVLGVIQIPRGWTATGTFLDIRDSSGNVITSSPPTYHAWRIYTYQSGGTIPDAYTLYTLGSRGINTENAFSGGETVVGAAGQALFLDINITSTSQFIGGGYVLLNAPS